MRASTNPLAYCEGGFYGGHLKPSDKIKPIMKTATASFGITALNELQELYNGLSLIHILPQTILHFPLVQHAAAAVHDKCILAHVLRKLITRGK